PRQSQRIDAVIVKPARPALLAFINAETLTAIFNSGGWHYVIPAKARRFVARQVRQLSCNLVGIAINRTHAGFYLHIHITQLFAVAYVSHIGHSDADAILIDFDPGAGASQGNDGDQN